MRTSHINLQFFRNHKGLKLDFPQDKSIIVLQGKNGAGKTSILEALYYSGFMKSFRSRHKEDLIFWENDYFRIEIDINSESANKLEVFYGKYPYDKRVLKLNEIEKPAVEFVGCLKTVLFTPKGILMLTDEPSLRRSYLNRLLILTKKKFLPIFLKYEKALKQRNSLLKEQKSNFEVELAVWDEELIKYGNKIIEFRQEAIEFLAKKTPKHYQEISGQKQQFSMEYRTNASVDNAEYQQILQKSLAKDTRYRVTQIGPHRDDLLFFLDEHLVKCSASQGELRSILLALKLAEAEYVEKKCGEKPILLFDDVFSELDQERQLHLIEHLHNYQTFITAAEEHCLKEKIDNVHVISL